MKKAESQDTIIHKTESCIINSQYTSTLLYDIYIKIRMPKEAEKFSRFFSIQLNASEYIDEVVTYETTVALLKTNLSVMLPKETIQAFFNTNPNTNAVMIAEK
jgi:hypothetical protein